MKKKMVLIVDRDHDRTEKLAFIVRLGQYETRSFDNPAAVFNWVKYGCEADDALCLLFRELNDLTQVLNLVELWRAAGMLLPVVLLQRGQGAWNSLLPPGAEDHFFICEPESVMQILEILTEIKLNKGQDTAKKDKDGAGVMSERVLCK